MGMQTINLGNYANDGTGDDLRTAFQKVNDNFDYITNEGVVVGATNLGNGHGLFVQKNPTTLNLEFNSFSSTDNSITFSTSNDNTINLQSHTRLQNDSAPTLSNNLNLNGHYTYGGDAHNTVYGYDVSIGEIVQSLIVRGNPNLTISMGTITSPTGSSHVLGGYNLDFNGTGNINGFSTNPKNDYDFGPISSSTVVTSNGHTLLLSGNLTTTGSKSITLNATATTTVTLPASGTLATTSDTLNQFATTSSSQLAAVISDETGTGSLVFNNNPTLTGVVTANNISAGGYIYVAGDLKVNNTMFDVDGASGDTTIAGWLSVAGAVITNVAPGGYSFDGQTCTANVASGGTVTFSDFSGSVLVNDFGSGSVTLYLVGGVGTTAVGSSGSQVGTMTYNAGANGYIWTNTLGSASTFSFVATRTRAHG